MAAKMVYFCYCAHRVVGTLRAIAGRTVVHEETGVSIAYCSTMKTELIEAGWVKALKGDVIELLKGDFTEALELEIKTVGISNPSDKEFDNQTSCYKTQLDNQTTSPVNELDNRTQFDNQTGTEVAPLLPKTIKSSTNSISLSAHAREASPLKAVRHPALEIFTEVYKNHPSYGGDPPIHSQERMAREVADMDCWRKVAIRLRDNGTPAKNIGTLLEVYEGELKRGSQNGRHQKHAGTTRTVNQQPQVPAGGFDPWAKQRTTGTG